MKWHRIVSWLVGVAWLPAGVSAGDLPERDARYREPVTLNTSRTFPAVKSRAQWQGMARDIKTQVLVSAGLWPMPERGPLKATRSGRKEYGDFAVEKVWIQTWPGFYLGGNLYSPVGHGEGPFPGVLNPHGHWRNGRLEDSAEGSIPARCIHFARMGMVALSIDMVGYNDTRLAGERSAAGYNPHRNFGTNEADALWGISLMGLQTWNCLRALDWLAEQPEVDRDRLACTGASGGGTQTFLLGAIDPRLKAQAPMVMVSHIMQGGCSCENMPGLRVDFSNMEFAAAAAPRPQILIGATGDWTRMTLEVEGPAVAGIYSLLGARDRLLYDRFHFNHNYNRTTREAVYGWFGRWLLERPEAELFKEKAYPAASNLNLRVWADGEFPADALTQEQLIAQLIQTFQEQLRELRPADKKELAEYKEAMMPAWRRTLLAELPARDEAVTETLKVEALATCIRTRMAIGRRGRGDRVPAELLTPLKGANRNFVVLAHPLGRAGCYSPQGEPLEAARAWLERGHPVLLLDAFLTGEMTHPAMYGQRHPFTKFFTTYNRTECQERVQDLLTACAAARGPLKAKKVLLCGLEQAGLWALLAAPGADGVVADCQEFDAESTAPWLDRDYFVPGLRRMGGFAGAATLAAPQPLLLHHTGTAFTEARWLREVYQGIKAGKVFREEPAALPPAAGVAWAEATVF